MQLRQSLGSALLMDAKIIVLIIKNRHPDGREASERFLQRASRAEGPCVSFRWCTVFMKPLLSRTRYPLIVALLSDSEEAPLSGSHSRPLLA